MKLLFFYFIVVLSSYSQTSFHGILKSLNGVSETNISESNRASFYLGKDSFDKFTSNKIFLSLLTTFKYSSICIYNSIFLKTYLSDTLEEQFKIYFFNLILNLPQRHPPLRFGPLLQVEMHGLFMRRRFVLLHLQIIHALLLQRACYCHTSGWPVGQILVPHSSYEPPSSRIHL